MTDNDKQQSSGTSFNEYQKAIDDAKNEKLKDENGTESLPEEDANNQRRRSHKTGTARKKTGGGKQSNPGM
jgi:collagenase-like PrtC family protease